MKTLAALLLATTTTGCLVVTRTTTTTTKVGSENGEAVPTKLDHLTLAASATEHTLTVHAVASGTCSRDVTNVFEVRASKHLAMGGAEDPRAKVFGLLLSPVTIPVTAITSSVALLGGDTVTTVKKVDHKEVTACTRPADNVPLAVELPSGNKDLTHTDHDGSLLYAIPLVEPYDGTITVRSGAVARDVEYHQAKPAYVAARAALETCGAGAATLALQVNDHGGAQLAWVAGDGDAAITECVRTQLAKVVFPVRGETIELPFGLEHVVDTARRITPVCARVEGDDIGQRTLERVLEEQGLFVSANTCEERYTGWVERGDSSYTVHVKNAAGARHTTVASAADIPAAYRQLVHVLVDREADAHGEARTATVARPAFTFAPAEVEEHDAAPEPAAPESETRSVIYGRLGFGSLTTFGAGYRFESGHLGLDAVATVGTSSSTLNGGIKGELMYISTPASTSSWYYGAGASFGSTQVTEYSMTLGGNGGAFELTAGYEFAVGGMRSFLQSDLTMPGYELTDGAGDDIKAPTTFVVSLGLGGVKR